MSSAAAAEAECARHPGVAARGTCARCGTFMCSGCEWRVRLNARPMCTGCWELRAAHVASLPQPGAPGSAGLILGFVSLLPLPPLQLLSLVVNVVSLAKAEPGRPRWRPKIGLALTVVGGLLTLLLIVLAD